MRRYVNDSSSVQAGAPMHPPHTRRRRKPLPRPPARGATGRKARPTPVPRADRLRLALADHEHVERLARRFRALGDPTRSKLVFALSLGELCVSDLAQALGTTLSATSHQLRILRDLEIVRVRRDGRSQLYALNEQAFGFCAPRSCQ